MAAPAATENRALDALLVELRKIGTAGAPGPWLTSATVQEGYPLDPLPEETNPLVLVQHVLTEPRPEGEGGTSLHDFRLHFVVWCIGKNMRECNSVKADVLRAVFAGEAALTTALQQPVYPATYEHRVELNLIGRKVAAFALFVDTAVSHSAP